MRLTVTLDEADWSAVAVMARVEERPVAATVRKLLRLGLGVVDRGVGFVIPPVPASIADEARELTSEAVDDL